MNSNRTNNHDGRRKASRIVLGQNLPWLPNWLPLSSLEPTRVESNLEALLGTAQRLWGKDYPEWLGRLDNQFSVRLARLQDANLWPEQETPGVQGRPVGRRAAA
jgi:hypothetical protein